MPPDAPVMTTTRGRLLTLIGCPPQVSTRCGPVVRTHVLRRSSRTGLEAGRADARLAQTVGALEQQGVDERLREIAPQLALHDVVLLGEQPGWSHGRSVAFEPAQRVLAPTEVQLGQRHEESTQDERARALVQGHFGIVAEAVHVPVVAQLLQYRGDRGEIAGVPG